MDLFLRSIPDICNVEQKITHFNRLEITPGILLRCDSETLQEFFVAANIPPGGQFVIKEALTLLRGHPDFALPDLALPVNVAFRVIKPAVAYPGINSVVVDHPVPPPPFRMMKQPANDDSEYRKRKRKKVYKKQQKNDRLNRNNQKNLKPSKFRVVESKQQKGVQWIADKYFGLVPKVSKGAAKGRYPKYCGPGDCATLDRQGLGFFHIHGRRIVAESQFMVIEHEDRPGHFGVICEHLLRKYPDIQGNPLKNANNDRKRAHVAHENLKDEK